MARVPKRRPDRRKEGRADFVGGPAMPPGQYPELVALFGGSARGELHDVLKDAGWAEVEYTYAGALASWAISGGSDPISHPAELGSIRTRLE